MIGFAIGMAIWFLVIMPAILRTATNSCNPQRQECILEKLKYDMKDMEQQAEIRRLEMQNIALSTYREMQDRERRMSYADVQRHFDCSQCCQFSCSSIHNAGMAEVVRDK